jgi:hypothetical protein
MLTQTLRSLESDDLITRTATPTVPVTVSYELTDLGLSLHPARACARRPCAAHPFSWSPFRRCDCCGNDRRGRTESPLWAVAESGDSVFEAAALGLSTHPKTARRSADRRARTAEACRGRCRLMKRQLSQPHRFGNQPRRRTVKYRGAKNRSAVRTVSRVRRTGQPGSKPAPGAPFACPRCVTNPATGRPARSTGPGSCR